MLTPAQRQSLDARITQVQRAGLGDIAVAIVPSIGDYSPNQVAVEIYRTWKVGSVAPIGSAHRNVGVLLLIVPKELAPDGRGQCWINTGTGSEGIITDATAGAICRDSIIPHLRTKDYAGAVGAGISALEARMRRDSALVRTPFVSRPPPPAVEPDDSFGVPFGIIGVALLLAFGFAGRQYARHRRRKCPRCGRQMRRLDEQADDAKLDAGQRLEESLRSVDYDVWVCDCGESKVITYRSWFSKYGDCRKCHRRTASSSYTILVPATTSSSGLAENRHSCKGCGAAWIDRLVLPQVVESSSSSSSSSSSGSGSSFGGSGSTSGGGGGSSY